MLTRTQIEAFRARATCTWIDETDARLRAGNHFERPGYVYVAAPLPVLPQGTDAVSVALRRRRLGMKQRVTRMVT